MTPLVFAKTLNGHRATFQQEAWIETGSGKKRLRLQITCQCPQGEWAFCGNVPAREAERVWTGHVRGGRGA